MNELELELLTKSVRVFIVKLYLKLVSLYTSIS